VGDTLIGEGYAPAGWFAHAALIAPTLAGVGAWRPEPLQPRELPALRPLVAAVEEHRVFFDPAVSELDPAATRVVAGMVPDVVRLDSAAASLGYGLRLEVVGSADDVGTPEDNARLRADRAARVAGSLTPLLPPDLRIATALAPADSATASEVERARHRSAYLRVDVTPGDSATAAAP